MSGTSKGGIKTRNTILKRNPNHFREIGRIGGSRKVSKGFGKMSKKQRIEAGRKGGSRNFTVIDNSPFAEGFRDNNNQSIIRKWLKR